MFVIVEKLVLKMIIYKNFCNFLRLDFVIVYIKEFLIFINEKENPMRRKGQSKNKTLEIHTRRRTLERIGFVPSRQQYREMNQICSDGNYFCFLEKQSLTRSKAIIYFNNEYIPVIFDKKHNQIVTVLSVSMLSDKERALFKQAIERQAA